MTILIRIITLVVASLALTACDNADYRDHQGNSGRFADFHGRWLVINYWATWCKPCVKEIPELNQFAQQNHRTAVIFGVDYDSHNGDTLQQGIDKLGIEFPVLITDPTQVLGFQRPSVLPTTLIFDPDGKLRKTLVGPQTAKGLSAIIGATPE